LTVRALERSASPIGALADFTPDSAVVAFENASVAFGRRTIWSGANFELKAGEFVGL